MIALSHRISPTTVGRIVELASKIVWIVLLERNYLSIPYSQSSWKTIGKDFDKQWNFLQCLGEIDGKHVVIEAPSWSASEFCHYEYSIFLSVTCDANYKLFLVNVMLEGKAVLLCTQLANFVLQLKIKKLTSLYQKWCMELKKYSHLYLLLMKHFHYIC